MLFLVTALLFHFFVPASRVFDMTTSSVGIVVGLIVFVLGFFLPLWASKIFKEENTEILPTSAANRALVTRGPFRFTRNPMYLGMVTALVGVAIMIGTLPMFIAALAHFLMMNFVFIPFEEEKMQRQFKDGFITYKNQVRRWL